MSTALIVFVAIAVAALLSMAVLIAVASIARRRRRRRHPQQLTERGERAGGVDPHADTVVRERAKPAQNHPRP